MTAKLPVKPVLEAVVRSKVAPKAHPHPHFDRSAVGPEWFGAVEVVATCRYCGKRRLCALITWLDPTPDGDQRWRGAPACRGCRQRTFAF